MIVSLCCRLQSCIHKIHKHIFSNAADAEGGLGDGDDDDGDNNDVQ